MTLENALIKAAIGGYYSVSTISCETDVKEGGGGGVGSGLHQIEKKRCLCWRRCFEVWTSPMTMLYQVLLENSSTRCPHEVLILYASFGRITVHLTWWLGTGTTLPTSTTSTSSWPSTASPLITLSVHNTLMFFKPQLVYFTLDTDCKSDSRLCQTIFQFFCSLQFCPVIFKNTMVKQQSHRTTV